MLSAVAPDLLKVLSILLDKTVRISAVDQEDLKHTGNQKMLKVLQVINNSIIYMFSKDFTNHRKTTYRAAVVFRYRPFPDILKYRDHR